MGRLDSELWRFKLRGSLIRHLPLLCFVTIIEVKVMSGHQVKKVKQNNFVI